jgi:LDH2 family malate/lactate/ureidoglycolate dehydrogenase
MGQLQGLVKEIFAGTGMRDADAELLANSLIVADLSGTHSHGVLRVPEYVKKLTVDGVDPRGVPKIVSDRGGALVVDGGNSMGQIGSAFAMRAAIERARTTGIATVAVRGSNHNGALSFYTEMAMGQGMIGWATTNALPTMAPVGGAERILGIDPLAISIPAKNESPISYDAAFSGTAHGKIRVYAQKGLELEDDWALDSDGQPTTDPLEAIDGLLRPIGGYKGASLALIMGVLSSMLSGAAYGTELGDMESGPVAGMDGHFFMVLNIKFFVDYDEFVRRVDKAIWQVHETRKAPGVNRTWMPGEREFDMRMKNREHGIPLSEETLVDLVDVAEKQGTDVAELRSALDG